MRPSKPKKPPNAATAGQGVSPERPFTMLEAAKHLLMPSKRSNVPPFIVMDVMAAAAAHRGVRAPGRPHGGGPAGGARPGDRAAGGAGGARPWPHRLYRDARDPVAAGAHRAALPRHIQSGARSRPRGGHHRLLGRLHPGVPGAVRGGRPGGAGQSRLSALPAHPVRARLRAGADRDFRRDALGAVGQGADRRPPGERRSRAW